MTFDPSALAICAFVLLGASLLFEAYLTYRDWCRRWQERHRPTPRPRVVVRRYRDTDDQAPFGHGTSLVG
jgi:hypothetical protein